MSISDSEVTAGPFDSREEMGLRILDVQLLHRMADHAREHGVHLAEGGGTLHQLTKVLLESLSAGSQDNTEESGGLSGGYREAGRWREAGHWRQKGQAR